jgi:asparagine synthetase B (glutamine-hydrolysing)
MQGSGLSPLEIASGLVWGLDLRAPRVPRAADPIEPIAALEAAIRPALARPPCLVSYSGGRDSAAVLAVAAHLARREGHALPIPATNRFRDVAASDETEWQERIVRHLGLEDWVKLEHTDELDCVGPFAREVLSRHGLLWPFNAHFHVPLLRTGRGGSLLTGVGGDEAFSSSQWLRAQLVLSGGVRPAPRDVLRVGFALSPASIRTLVMRRRLPRGVLSWLRPEARQAVARLWAAEVAGEPLRWAPRLRWLRRLRHFEVGARSLDRLGQTDGIEVRNPLCEPGFLAALAALPRRRRFRYRTDAMRALFGDLLPDAALARITKASFDTAFWNRQSREFARTWEGEGVDAQLVDHERLRRIWTSDHPDPGSFLLAQAAWLARCSAGQVLEHGVDRGLEGTPGSRPTELPGRQGGEVEERGWVPRRDAEAPLHRKALDSGSGPDLAELEPLPPS